MQCRMEMNPKQLWNLFGRWSPVAAYIYPEVDCFFLKRIGEVQFYNDELAKNASLVCSNTCINGYQLHITFRPVRFARPEEVGDRGLYAFKLIRSTKKRPPVSMPLSNNLNQKKALSPVGKVLVLASFRLMVPRRSQLKLFVSFYL